MLTVVTTVINDHGFNDVPSDFTVRVAGNAAPGSAGTTYTLVPGDYVVSADARRGYTFAYGGACGPTGSVTLSEGSAATCTVVANDPSPTAGREVNALPARGTVRIKLPGRKRFRELKEGEQLPEGTTVDTLKGRVTLFAAGGQKATFYDGIFKIAQGNGARPLTTLTLTEALSCPKAGQRDRGGQEEEAAPLGRRERQVPSEGQAQRGDRRRHEVARRGPLHVDPHEGHARPSLGARLREEEDGDRAGRQAVHRTREALEREQEPQALVDGEQFGRLEPSHRPAEPLGVDDGGLLHEHPCLDALEFDHRSKARGSCACRCRRDEDRAELEELVRLDDHRVASAALLVSPGAGRRGEPEDLAANHLQRVWGELGQVLADAPHLRAILSILSQLLHLGPERRARAAPCGGLPQRGPHRFRIVEAVSTDDVERRGGGVVQAHVE